MGRPPSGEFTILFLPTEEDSIALGTLRKLKDRKVVDPGRILVFCSEAKKTLFESQPEVSEVVVYQPGQTWRNLRAVLGLARMRVDVVVAIRSRRSIFRAHKRLFRLLPARARLVFNEHGDCQYVTRSLQNFKHTFRDLLGIWTERSVAARGLSGAGRIEASCRVQTRILRHAPMIRLRSSRKHIVFLSGLDHGVRAAGWRVMASRKPSRSPSSLAWLCSSRATRSSKRFICPRGPATPSGPSGTPSVS